MGHSHCPNCNKPFRQHSDRFNRFEDFHNFKHQKRVVDDSICERFICDDRFKVRLGGLEGGLAFRLRQLVDCVVKMQVDCGGTCKEVLAQICFVGRDYVEAKILDEAKENTETAHEEEKKKPKKEPKNHCKKKKKENNFLIVPIENIGSFELRDDCDGGCSCDDECDCDCDCH